MPRNAELVALLNEAADRIEELSMSPENEPTASRLRTAADALAGEDASCAWKLNDNPDDDIWESVCGESWLFMAGGPAENGYKFCHGCGKPVVIIADAARAAQGDT